MSRSCDASTSRHVLRRRGAVAHWFLRRLRHHHPALTPLTVGAAGAVLLWTVLVVAGVVMLQLDETFGWVTTLDRSVAGWFDRQRTDRLTAVMQTISGLTGTWMVLGLATGAGSMLALLAVWRQLTMLAVAVSVELAVFVSVTFLIARPRPDVAFGNVPVTGSYPSGHVAMAVALYGALTLIASSTGDRSRVRSLGPPAAVLTAIAVAISRLYLGLHYLSDVLAGAALGGGSLVVAVVAARALPMTAEAKRSAGSSSDVEGAVDGSSRGRPVS